LNISYFLNTRLKNGGGGGKIACTNKFTPLVKTTLHPDNPAAAFRRWRRREREKEREREREREIPRNCEEDDER
jgi:hypothetical protein